MRHKSLGERVKEDGEGEGKLTFAATTLSIDRMGEVVIPRGCEESLPAYKENPVLHYGHQSMPFFDGQKESLPIGRCEDLRFTEDDTELHYDAVFSEKNEFGQVVKGLVEEGTLRATSIGFKPRIIDTEPILDGQKGVTHREWDLLENSIVPIPANQNAVRRSISKSAVVARFKDHLLIPTVKLADGVYRGVSDPGPNGHTHSFLIEVREGVIVLGATSVDEAHWHLVTDPSETETVNGHTHSVVLQRQMRASVTDIMLRNLGLPSEVLEWSKDDIEAVKRFLALRDELDKPDPEAGAEELKNMLTDIGENLYDTEEVVKEAIPGIIEKALLTNIRGK